MKRLSSAVLWGLALLVVAFGFSRASAAELIYVHDPGCPYCRLWESQIGPSYAKSTEAKRAALKPIDKRDSALSELKLARPVRYTPTFILMQAGDEIGRIEGYPGEDAFWGLLARLMEKLPGEAQAFQHVGKGNEPGLSIPAKERGAALSGAAVQDGRKLED